MTDLLGMGMSGKGDGELNATYNRSPAMKPIAPKAFHEGEPTNFAPDNTMSNAMYKYYSDVMHKRRHGDAKAVADQKQAEPGVMAGTRQAIRTYNSAISPTMNKMTGSAENPAQQEANLFKGHSALAPEIDRTLTVTELAINDLGDVKLHIRNNNTQRDYDISFNMSDDTDLIAEINQHILTNHHDRIKTSILKRLEENEILPSLLAPANVKERKTVKPTIKHASQTDAFMPLEQDKTIKAKSTIKRTVNLKDKCESTSSFVFEAQNQPRPQAKIDTSIRKISSFR